MGATINSCRSINADPATYVLVPAYYHPCKPKSWNKGQVHSSLLHCLSKNHSLADDFPDPFLSVLPPKVICQRLLRPDSKALHPDVETVMNFPEKMSKLLQVHGEIMTHAALASRLSPEPHVLQ